MAIRGFVCVLAIISAAMAAGKVEKPSLRLIADLLRPTAQDGLEMDYCPPTIEQEVLKYSESYSRTPLLCLQASQADRNNDEVLDVIAVMLEIRGAGNGIKVVAEDIKWSKSIANIIQLPHESKTLFDSNWTDSPDYKRWEHFLLTRLKLPPSYFRPQESLPRLKRNTEATSELLAAIAQNIEEALNFARSLKNVTKETSNYFKSKIRMVGRGLIVRSTTENINIEKLKKKGKKAKQLLENIEKNITELQKGKQELKYDIEEFYAKLTAAEIRQKYKGPSYTAEFNGDGYAIKKSPVYEEFHFKIDFKTSAPDGLLLFSTNGSSNLTEYWYSLAVVKGRLVFRYKLPEKDELEEHKIKDTYVSDDRWHEVAGSLDEESIFTIMDFYVDKRKGEYLDATFLPSNKWGPLYIGGIPERHQSLGVNIASFTGCMNISFNDKRYDFKNNDTVGLKNVGFHTAYYFNGEDGYAVYTLPDGKIGKKFKIKLQLKTGEQEGILFSASSDSYAFDDALSLEMKNGELHYYLNNGDVRGMIQYPKHLKPPLKGRRLDDKKWHTILAEKRGSTLILTVDGDSIKGEISGSNEDIANTSNKLYIGGIPDKIPIPMGLTNDKKFHGCLQVVEPDIQQDSKLFQLNHLQERTKCTCTLQ